MNCRQLLKAILVVSQVFLWTSGVMAQTCTLQSDFRLTPAPGTCQQAQTSGNIVPFFGQCRDYVMDNTNTGPSNQVSDHKCTGNVQPAHDLFLYANNPYSQIPNYDGSLVFRWVDWPRKAQGVKPPYFAVHGEVNATLAGINVQSINCGDGFALENAICVDTPLGNQFYTPAGTIPTLAQLTPIVRQIAGVAVDVTNVSFWINIACRNQTDVGDIKFEVSAYKAGFLCGDPTGITLNQSGSHAQGSAASACLCSSALYGGVAEPANAGLNLPLPCGVESASSAWYKINAPYGCNKITASLGAWGGSGQYNIVILSGVSCPGTSGTNPITGVPTFLPGQQMATGAKIVGSACGAPAITACNPVPSGEYYVVVSGKTERTTFTLNVAVDDVSPSIGTASSAQNNTNVCSGTPVVVSTTGSVLPLNGTCGQNVAWYYSNTLSFNPYNAQGTYASSGTLNDTIQLPANTTCQPKTYYIKGIISDDGTTANAGCKGTTNTITVTVYPEIGNVTVNNSQCLISVATRCSNFTVNGRPGVSTFTATFADNGATKNFVISNGLAGCNQVIQEVVSCSGNCTQPTGSAVSVCDTADIYNFYVDVNFAPGSAASYYIQDNLGGSFAVNGAGTYRVGPYRNTSNVFLSINNPTDAACNLPLGTFTKDCNTIRCANLVSATTNVSGNSICEGSQTVMQATVDHGTVNVDFSVQWKMNGVAIPNGNNLTFVHTFGSSQGCSAESQEFTVEIKCLNGGTPATVSTMSAGTLVVYPKPRLGRDFIQDTINCNVKPIDLCGGLVITYTPTTNPTAGAAPLQVNYTVSVAGAPSGCATTGSYQVNCPGSVCTNTAGNGAASLNNKTYCYGEQFNVQSTAATLGNGFSQMYAVTSTNPYSNLNTAVANAIANHTTFGPVAGGNANYTFTNGTDYGPGEFYFIPFVSMNSINSSVAAYSTSGTLNAPIFGSSVSKTITIPQLPYCSGTTSFKIHFDAHRASGTGNPIDGVTGILTYSGGSTTTVTLDNNNYAGNPSGQTITLTASSTFGSNVDYNFTVYYQSSLTAPFVCPTCNDVGTPIHVTLLPQITLATINPQTICIGGSVNLLNLNPAANVAGTYTWYDGNPGTTGQVVADPTNVNPTNGQQYFVKFAATADSLCGAQTSVTFNTSAPPTLNPIPAQAPVCFGTNVNLTLLEPGISTGAGTFVWYKGNPDSSGVRLPNAFATHLLPIDGQLYYAVFTDALTGCSSQVSVSYSVTPVPVLNAVPTQNICAGTTFDLTSLQSSISLSSGTFAWYLGDPNNGGTLLTPQQAVAVQPTLTTIYYTLFTDASTGCTAKGNVTVNVNALPVLTTPNPAPECSGTVIDLSALEQGITSTAGTFTWYFGDPANGGVQLSQSQTQTFALDSTTTLYVLFTNAITSCSNTTHFTYTVKPSPALNQVPTQSICAGTTVDLTALQAQIASPIGGLFTWFLGDPANGGVQLTQQQAASQVPVSGNVYYVQYLAVPSLCTGTTTVTYNVNNPTVLNPIADPALVCAGGSIDLTTLQASITANAGTFQWYLGNPSSGGTLVTNTTVSPANNAKYYTVFTDSATGCTSSLFITAHVANAIAGVTASYDCAQNQLVVNLSGATGGSGSGYAVASNSPDTAGAVLANGARYTVIVTDSLGCTTTLTGAANCLVCNAGVATSAASVACCGTDSIVVSLTGQALGSGKVIAYAITPQATGPATAANVQAAAAANNVFLGDSATGGAVIKKGCADITAGNYYITPFIANAPVAVPIIYDTLAGCRPSILICPSLTPLDTSIARWAIDTFLINFPDSSVYNVNQQYAFGLTITAQLLHAVLPNGLPCLDLGNLYHGNPNGTWSVHVHNSGTGPISFSIPNFSVVVSADSCTLITNGVDQVTPIAGLSATIGAGSSQSLSFEIPQLPSNFPTLDTSCQSFGTPVLIEICTGVDEVDAFTSLSIYPNPSDAKFTVDGNLKNAGDYKILVTDLLGSEVSRIERKADKGSFKEVIDLSANAPGVYFVTIRSGNQSMVRRIAKQ